jgi:1-deoxy-D-xylulose-5-phosphate synthase
MLAAIEFMRNYEDGLSSVRYPRDNVSPLITDRLGDCPAFELGKARCLTPDLDVQRGGIPDVAVLAFGTPAIDAVKAADALAGEYKVAVYDARFAKPVDSELIRALFAAGIPVVTVEDHSIVGGFGAAVLEAAQQLGVDASRTIRLGIPDHWIIQDSRSKQLAEAGIDQAGITSAIRRAAELRSADTTPTNAVAVRSGERTPVTT